MAKKIAKTNAMRILDQKKIPYEVRTYPEDGPIAAVDVAAYLGQPTGRLFKTLVTTDLDGGYYVFCLPGDGELDLKKAARAAGVKKIEMLKQKDLLPLTGYIHGGCSPVGMKKVFPTFLHESALDWETIYVSGGKIGMQMELDPRALQNLLPLQVTDLTK